MIKEIPSDMRTKMAFACVGSCSLVTVLAGLVEQAIRSELAQRIDKLVSCGAESLPDIFERCPVYIPDDDAAACAAKDVAERIDVDAFCSEKVGFAIDRSEGLYWF